MVASPSEVRAGAVIGRREDFLGGRESVLDDDRWSCFCSIFGVWGGVGRPDEVDLRVNSRLKEAVLDAKGVSEDN